MKQSKVLTRRHYTYLEKHNVPRDIVSKLRFYRESGGEYVFVLDGKLVVWDVEVGGFKNWKK